MKTIVPTVPRKRPRSLAHDVVATLTARIRVGTLRPGDKLPSEAEIMTTSGVSRTVVREALSRLQAGGLVETRHGIGTFVLSPRSDAGFYLDPAAINTTRDILAILELRISVETEAAGLAALRRTDAQLAAMRASLDAFQAGLAKADNAIAPDFQFHLEIAQATGNRYFVEILSHLGSTIIPRTRINSAQLAQSDQRQYLTRVNVEHEDIYAAIARRDGEAARAAMRTHLSNSRERLRRAQEAAESRRHT